MSTTTAVALPKLIQRFRARELQRLINRGGLRSPNRTNEGRTPLFMQNLKNIDVKKDIRMGVPLHNPFLPRALFKQEVVEGEVDPSHFPFGLSSLGNNVGNVGKGKGKKETGKKETGKKKERKLWAPPKYSLRRQKELVKAARTSGTLHLLPPGPKLSLEELQEAKREARRRARAAKATSFKVQQSITQAKVSKAKASLNDQNAPPPKTQQETASQETSTSQRTPKTYSTRSYQHQKRRQPRWLLRTSTHLSRRRTSPSLGYPGITFNWTGKLPPKPHSSLTIYATRRRMFKGHKWERHLTKRRAQIAVRMRDMNKRVERFKNVYVRRRAKPLKPAVPRKKESLPF